MKTAFSFKKRRAGILLHPSSLPGTPGNGDVGTHAYRFIDFLANSSLSVWQMLPLGPPQADLSPYQCQSVHAANARLISIEKLVEKGWLSTPPMESHTEESYRYARLKEARHGFVKKATPTEKEDYNTFVEKNRAWLDDYALFRALKEAYGDKGWWDWAPEHRNRDVTALKKVKQELKETVEQQYFEQYVFFSQWKVLKTYAHEKGIYLFGDMPIFIADDSADVWAKQEYFLLDKQGKPTVVAGVPPDYFSATGQRWGNPHYNWKAMEADGFQWWIERIRSLETLFDVVRVDHFRGFEASWEIPASEQTAINGRWVKVPGEKLFTVLQKETKLPLVAEDLGVITEEVTALRDKFHFPGMKILQFAFDSGPDNPYLPHHHLPNCVVYTGTHDNDTTLGWFKKLPTPVQQYVCEYLRAYPHEMPWPLIETAFASVAKLAIIPMQDVLSADSDQRMNTPGVPTGNWRWRFDWSQLTIGVTEKLRHLAKFYERG